MIETTQELATACKDFAQHDYVTVDTEFLRETTFWPILCLIQIAGPDDECIVDPMADGIDLQPFFELMADTSVVKVFHAARQDVEIVYHLGGLVPKPLFDTQVAAMVCGYGDSVAYNALVSRITGGVIDKSSRFTDWARRPLTTKQLDYALADVTHLRDVYQSLKADLEKKNRKHWVDEEMDVLTNPETYDLPVEKAWSRLKMRVRKPRELAVMKFVAQWREEQARDRDVPRGRVVKDDAIYEIAQQQPRDEKALSRLRALPRGFENSRFAEGLIDAVDAAMDIPEEDLERIPRATRSPEGTGAAAELLKVLLKAVAEQNGVATKIIATMDDLEKIAADDDADVATLRGWRHEMFGKQALELKRGEIALGFEDRRIQVIELE
ncbi:ribonuclease D [Ahrensia sp. R2A130]|uniref:ribonuclease D n=1 Tax=Ahrensia sp. R2A130 TaxID=744979 RepID=UPI00058E0C31|nr:ribonuclease D [Ahrensia sp. R2A130]